MVIDTTDVRSHGDEQILKAADFLTGSEVKQLVFEEIYRSKNSGKTAKEIVLTLSTVKKRSINVKQVLDTARTLDGHGYIETNKSKGELTFVKVAFFSLNKIKILRLARDNVARKKFRAKIYGGPTPSIKIKKPNIQLQKQKMVTEQTKIGGLKMEKTNQTWDVFISHASEDKDSIARPLSDALEEAGVKVWYDESELRIGDHLHKSIDKGIANSGYGIVILSENFFTKDWPQRELEGLVAKEMEGRKVILPLWHKVDAAFIRSKSLLLAGIIGIPTSKGIPFIVQEVLKIIKPGGQTPEIPRPPIELPKGTESRKSILEGTIQTLQKMDENAVIQTVKDMEFGELKKTYNDLLEGIALLDIYGEAKEYANIFLFLKETVLERPREEGAELFDELLNWFFETSTPMCKSAILEICSLLMRSRDLKEIALKHKGEFVAEFGRSDSYDLAGINAEIIQNMKSSLSSNDCTRIVDSSLSNSQIYGSWKAKQYLQKIIPTCEGKVDQAKIDKLYKVLT
jgi:hypothetical protein